MQNEITGSERRLNEFRVPTLPQKVTVLGNQARRNFNFQPSYLHNDAITQWALASLWCRTMNDGSSVQEGGKYRKKKNENRHEVVRKYKFVGHYSIQAISVDTSCFIPERLWPNHHTTHTAFISSGCQSSLPKQKKRQQYKKTAQRISELRAV